MKQIIIKVDMYKILKIIGITSFMQSELYYIY